VVTVAARHARARRRDGGAVTGLAWPDARAGDALIALAEACELAPRALELGAPSVELDAWLDEAARWIGVELEPIAGPGDQLAAMLRAAAPALVRTPDGLLAIVAARRDHLVILTPEGTRGRIGITQVAAAIAAPAAAPIRAAVSRELEAIGLRGARARRAEAVLIDTRLRGTSIGGVLALRVAPETSLRRQVRAMHLAPRIAAVAVAHLASYLLVLASWWALGKGALIGQLEAGWLSGWALLVGSAAAIRCVGDWAVGRVAIDAASAIKQRLLVGVLGTDLDGLRAEGVGRSLGRVFDAASLEQLVIGGGFAAGFAAIELVIAAAVLGLGAGGAPHVLLLVLVTTIGALAARRYWRRRRAWTERRLTLTHRLIEAMIGHATRLAQQPEARRHDDEDRQLAAYEVEAERMDRALVALGALVPRGWLVVSIAALTPAILGGDADVTGLAVALGGTMLAFAALGKLTAGLAQLAGGAIAWRSIAPILEAARRPAAVAPPGLALAAPSPTAPIASLRGVVYRPPRRGTPVLDDCELAVPTDGRLLLEGASGAGKSTMAALLAGLRRPDSGLVLAGGLDLASLGDQGWRRRIACAPQFHDNHLFSAPLAFNLLLGRSWPPRPEDLAEAQAVCEELGLGDVIGRMPGALFEMVGETGWQLSHGERCRVYLARTLLQGAPLIVLDESLAALDPETMQLAITCIDRRARAAIVIAHP